MSNWFVSSVGWTAVTAWVALETVSVGTYRRQLAAPTVGNERVFKCTAITTGVTGAAEPTWNITNNSTTVDSGVTWTDITGSQANQSAGSWTAPAARILDVFATAGRVSNGDTIYVSSDHAETQASALTFGGAATSVSIICVSRAGGSSMPPVSADKTTGGSVSTTGANDLQVGRASQSSGLYVYGLTFNAGSSSNAANLQLAPTAVVLNGLSVTFDTCTLVLSNTSTSSRILVGLNTNSNLPCVNVNLINTTMTFGAAGQGIILGNAKLDWANTASALLGTVPTTLFIAGSPIIASSARLHGVDLSALSTSIIPSASWGGFTFWLYDCKVHASLTPMASSPGTFSNAGDGGFLRLDNCSSDSTNYKLSWMLPGGVVAQDTSVIVIGGANDGVQANSWKIVTASTPAIQAPLILPPISRRYNTTGASKTITVYFAASAAAALTNAQIWLEVEALTSAGSPLSSITSNRVADLLSSTTAAAHATDSSAWDTGATARQNNHAYAIGDVFKTATAAGQIFIVTVAGTSATSEPAAYTGVADGASITTDRNGGSMTVRCMVRQKMTVTLTPQLAGSLLAGIRVAVASTTVYIDPKLNVA